MDPGVTLLRQAGLPQVAACQVVQVERRLAALFRTGADPEDRRRAGARHQAWAVRLAALAAATVLLMGVQRRVDS